MREDCILPYYDIEPQRGCLGSLVAGVLTIIILVLLSLTISSCSRKTIDIEDSDYMRVTYDTYNAMRDSIETQKTRIASLESESVKHDSVYIGHTDSVYIIQKGDTITIYKYERDIIYKESNEQSLLVNCLYDSINTYRSYSNELECKIDSISEKVHSEVITKEVRFVPWYWKISGILGLIMLIMIVLILVAKIYKLKFFS